MRIEPAALTKSIATLTTLDVNEGFPRPSSGWSMRPSCYSGPTAVPVEPIGARLRPAYRDAHAGLQAGAIVVRSSGDISPPTNQTGGDDYATSELSWPLSPTY